LIIASIASIGVDDIFSGEYSSSSCPLGWFISDPGEGDFNKQNFPKYSNSTFSLPLDSLLPFLVAFLLHPVDATIEDDGSNLTLKLFFRKIGKSRCRDGE
jgi:hypothetical protein